MKIYLSPSMQKDNKYAYGNTNEMEQCNKIADCLTTHLIRNGYEVKKAPKGQSMENNIKESNNYNCDLHIAIHTNAGGGSGPLVMVYSKETENMKYATPIYNSLEESSLYDHGYGVRVGSEMTNGNYMPAELSDTKSVAVYCECEFHDNKDLAKWIINNVDKIAESICRGVCRADGRAYIVPTKAKIYRVQVGAFEKESNANAMLDKVIKAGFKDAFINISTK